MKEDGASGSKSIVQVAGTEDTADDNDDWLESDDESKAGNEMGQRDSKKVQGKLYDEGYRAGITKGKESMVQVGFDSAYNEKGAPLGRRYGILLGTITALTQYASKRHSDMLEEIRSLMSIISGLRVDDLAERDWEALEHEREHGADISYVHRETAEESRVREQKLDELQQQVDKISQWILEANRM